MPREQLLHLLMAKPFRPFRLITTDDEIVDVIDPAMVLIAGDDITLGVPDPAEEPPAATDLLLLGFENIVSAELVEAQN